MDIEKGRILGRRISLMIYFMLTVLIIVAAGVYSVKYSASNDSSPNLLTTDYDVLEMPLLDQNGTVINSGDEFKGELILNSVLPDYIRNDELIVYNAEDIYSRVYIDGVLCGTFGTDDDSSKVTTKSHCYVRVPQSSAGKIITFDFKSISSGTNNVPVIHFGTRAGIISSVFETNIFTIVFFSVMLAVTVVLLELYIAGKKASVGGGSQLLFLSTFTLIAALWVFSGSQLIDFFGFSITKITYINELSYMVLIIPAVMYIYVSAISFKNITRVWVLFLYVITIAELIAYALNVISLSDTRIVTHIIFAVSMIITIVVTMTDFIRFKSEKSFVVFSAYFVMYSLLLLEVFRYYVYHGDKSETPFFQVGMIAFVIIIATSTVRKGLSLLIETVQISNLKRMAVEDSLTGLGSRAAYEAELIKLHGDRFRGKKYRVIFVDINGLKEINDENGHNAGDDAIKTVANSIKDVFDNEDYKKFRIGGDEFVIFAQADGSSDPDMASKIRERLEFYNNEKGKNYSVAIGEYVDVLGVGPHGDGTDFAEFVKKADELMYKNKAEIKGNVR